MDFALQINDDGSFRLERLDPNFTVSIQPDGFGLIFVRVNKIGDLMSFECDDWERTFGDKDGVAMMQWIAEKTSQCTM